MATDAARLGKTKAGERPREEGLEEERPQTAMSRAWQEPAGLWGFLTTAQSRRNGERLIVVSFLFLLLGGVNAALMRLQLAQPNNDFVTPGQYNRLFTMHGSTMMFLFVVPLMIGAGMLLLPSLLGARELPWPRLTSFVFWTITLGGLLLESSWLFGTVPDAGWTAYPPLTEKPFSPGPGVDFWLLSLMMIAVGGILGSAVLITTVFKSRAPGMTLGRMPLFAWAALTMAGVMFFAFTAILCAAAFLEFDRKLGTHFFDPTGGGSPLLWQYLFWVFGHPAVYIQLVPAAGLASTLLPVLTRQRIIGYRFLAAAFVLTGLASFGLWLDRTVTAGLSPLVLTLIATAAVLFAVLVAVQVSAWLATIWRGAGKWNTAYLFILGFIFLFVLGAIAGLMLALDPFDAQAGNSFFVVAHLHYVLFGTVVFPVFAGFYYWFPKFKGRFLDEPLGKWNFWLMFIGFNVAFFPMFISGLLGMPRRLYTYPSSSELNLLNLISTIGALVLATGVLVFLLNLVLGLLGGRKAPADPWGGDSLEWAIDSPVPAYGFRRIPIVTSRHPMWEPEGTDARREKMAALVDRLAEWPDTWRAALLTSVLGGEPQEVYRVAGPSIWPLVAALGMAVLFISFFFDQLVFAGLFLLGAVVLIIALIGWGRPTREASPVAAAELEDFHKSYGVPIRAHGSPTLGSWATGLTVLGFAAALAVTLLCYLYYRSDSPVWPPNGIPAPDRYMPLIATAFLVIGVLFLLLAARMARTDRLAFLRLALAAAFLLGVGFLALQVLSYVLPPLSPATNAYGSILYAVGFLMTLIAVVGLAILSGPAISAWRGDKSQGDGYVVRSAAVYWSFVLVAWLAVLVALYLAV